jgi:hypothetical protein
MQPDVTAARVLSELQGARYSRRICKTQRVPKNEPFVNPLIVVIQLIASEFSAGFS